MHRTTHPEVRYVLAKYSGRPNLGQRQSEAHTTPEQFAAIHDLKTTLAQHGLKLENSSELGLTLFGFGIRVEYGVKTVTNANLTML